MQGFIIVLLLYSTVDIRMRDGGLEGRCDGSFFVVRIRLIEGPGAEGKRVS